MKICLIISEKICEEVVPLIHDFDQLKYIFIARRRSHKEYEQWIKSWFKIKGIYTDISAI